MWLIPIWGDQHRGWRQREHHRRADINSYLPIAGGVQTDAAAAASDLRRVI